MATVTIAGTVYSSQTFRNGNPMTIPHDFTNDVTWAPSPAQFCNLVTLPKDFGNPVAWSPTPTHFNTPAVPPGTVTITLSGGAAGTTTTDAFGNYVLSGVTITAPATITVTPTLAGFVFQPASLTITISDSVNGIDFNVQPNV